MARGVMNGIMGAIWARRFHWMFSVWLALNVVFLRGIMDFKFMGIDRFFSWVYAIVLVILAWDIYHKAI